ncbi:MAG: hypothetical protein K6360_06065 [Deltaproteobacteria bacterium]
MDMQMAVMFGYKATRLLKDDPDTTDITIIALTVSVMGDRGEDVRAMCDGYLQKPIASNVLVSELARFLPHEFVSKPSTPKKGIFSFEASEADMIRGLLKAVWLKASRLKSNDEIEELARRSKRRQSRYP